MIRSQKESSNHEGLPGGEAGTALEKLEVRPALNASTGSCPLTCTFEARANKQRLLALCLLIGRTFEHAEGTTRMLNVHLENSARIGD